MKLQIYSLDELNDELSGDGFGSYSGGGSAYGDGDGSGMCAGYGSAYLIDDETQFCGYGGSSGDRIENYKIQC